MKSTVKSFTEIFNSLGEFAQTINNREFNPSFPYRSSIMGTKKFTGTESYEEANKLLMDGDLDSCSKIKAANVRLSKNGNSYVGSTKTQYRKSVTGCTPIVPNYLIGVPSNMVQAYRKPVKNRVINIIVECTCTFLTNPNKITECGAIILSAIKEAEAKGIRVNLYVCVKVADKRKKYRDKSYILFVKIKDAKSPLNALNCSYPIVNPSFLRRSFFRWIETLPPEYNIKGNSCYGIVMWLEQKEIPFKHDIIFNMQRLTSCSDMRLAIINEMEKTLK